MFVISLKKVECKAMSESLSYGWKFHTILYELAVATTIDLILTRPNIRMGF